MKAVVFEGVRKVAVKDVDYPKPKDGEVVVKVCSSGVCGTDLHIYEGEFLAHYPLIPGHEFSGVVEEVGGGVKKFKRGDRVAVDPSVFCGDCYFCKTNRGNHCLNWNGIGVTLNGGFAEYVVAPQANIYPIGDSTTFEEAAFIEPISCVVYALRRLKMKEGDDALIFGSGTMGLLLMQAIKSGGASRVVVVDLKPKKLRIAEDLGASATIAADGNMEKNLKDLAPLGFDVVVDATGVPKVVEGMFQYVKRTGKLLFFGVCPKDAKISLKPFDVYSKDLEIYGTFALCYTFYPAIELLENGAINVKPLLSHKIPIEDFPRAFDLMRSGDSLKVQVAMYFNPL
ncbi:MAG: zinc-dependent alcohol dehydrogenase family protein [bacterium]